MTNNRVGRPLVIREKKQLMSGQKDRLDAPQSAPSCGIFQTSGFRSLPSQGGDTEMALPDGL
jgi:hypothetical protein